MRIIRQEAANIIGATPDDVSVSVTEIREDGTSSTSSDKDEEPVTKIFSFDSMRSIISPAVTIRDMYDDDNTLYKNSATGRYVLALNLKKVTRVHLTRLATSSPSTVSSSAECPPASHSLMSITKKS